MQAVIVSPESSPGAAGGNELESGLSRVCLRGDLSSQGLPGALVGILPAARTGI
ncbi:MAG: hypothetical protein ACE5I8_04390 [Thermodesulfobacteriota bacterium]